MTCETVKASVWPPKHPDATLDYLVGFEEECSRPWRALHDFEAGEHIRIYEGGHEVGYEFEPTTPGRTGKRRPVFPKVVGETVTDGSVVWTCRALSVDSIIRTIDTAAWSVDDDEVTIAGELVDGFDATAKLGGGDDGQDYVVTVTAETSDGLTIPKVIILPVRVPQLVCP